MKNIEHIWSILCKKSIIDIENNNISLLESLEELNVDISSKEFINKNIKFPLDFELVSFWRKTTNSLKFLETKVEVFDPKGKKIFQAFSKISLPENKDRIRTRLRMKEMGITENKGYYIFKTSLKEKGNKKYKIVSEIPLFVKVKLKKK